MSERTRAPLALEVHTPGHGPRMVDTMGVSHVVGLSWATLPFRDQFGARALDDVEAVVVDAARLRLFDLYGPGGG